jgi:hypothetical protein
LFVFLLVMVVVFEMVKDWWHIYMI